jgi:hypothetical protein
MKRNVEDKVIVSILWTVDDLKEAFIKARIDPTEVNISRFLQDRYACRTLKEVSIQFGWEALSDIISNLQYDGVLPST